MPDKSLASLTDDQLGHCLTGAIQSCPHFEGFLEETFPRTRFDTLAEDASVPAGPLHPRPSDGSAGQRPMARAARAESGRRWLYHLAAWRSPSPRTRVMAAPEMTAKAMTSASW